MGYEARANNRRISQFYDGRAMRCLKASEEARERFVNDRHPGGPTFIADSLARMRVHNYIAQAMKAEMVLPTRSVDQWRLALARLVKELRLLRREPLIE